MQSISDSTHHEQGVQAIFAVTNFWEHAYTGLTALESRDKEAVQGMQASTFDGNLLTNHKKQHGLSVVFERH